MSGPYKGTVIPISTDLADGPKAFQEFVDSLPAADAITAVDLPAGTILQTCRTTQPAGWLFLNGATVAGAQTLYPELWSVVPAGWHSGADLVLPDARGRMVIGLDPATASIDAIGEKAGALTVVIGTTNLPPHTHTLTSDSHDHGLSDTSFSFIGNKSGVNNSGGLQLATGGQPFTRTSADSHTHTVGNGPGTSVPLSILPPVIAFNLMIRAK